MFQGVLTEKLSPVCCVPVCRFPLRHFGKVLGLVIALSALFSLLQYLCLTLVQDVLNGDPLYVSIWYKIDTTANPICSVLLSHFLLPLYLQVNVGLTVLGLVAFVHPVFVYLHCRRRAKERASS